MGDVQQRKSTGDVRPDPAGTATHPGIRREAVYVGMVILVALVVRLLAMARPVGDLAALSLSDDAFYYFEIARNINRGLGSTFDGLGPTNGYHPLWMAVCVLAFRLFHASDSAPIYAAVSIAVLADVVSTYLVYIITLRLARNAVAALCAMLIYAVGVHQVLLAINGLETSVTVLTFLMTAYLCLRVLERPASGRHLILLGVSFGLLCMARTDVGLFLTPAVVAAGVRAFRAGTIKASLGAGLAALVVVSPWLLWNLRTFGSISQVSGQAYIYWNHEIFAFRTGQGTAPPLLSKLSGLAYAVGAHICRYSPFGKLTAFLAPLALACVVLSRGKAAERRSEIMFWFWFVVVALVMLVYFHGLYRWMIGPHYYAPLAVAILVFVFAAAARVRARWVVALLLVLGLVNVVVQYRYVKPPGQPGGYWPWQRTYLLETRKRIDDTFPPGTVIAVTDSGIHGYYSPHTVINLDCVVNNACFRAIRSGDLYGYLREHKVNVLLLNEYHEEFMLSRLLPRTKLERKSFPWDKTQHYYRLKQ